VERRFKDKGQSSKGKGKNGASEIKDDAFHGSRMMGR